MEAQREELSDAEWAEWAKVMRVSECSQCRKQGRDPRTISHREAEEPKTCGRRTCHLAEGEEIGILR